MNPRDYLLERFTSDAAALRARAASLRDATKAAGPNAEISLRMAAACDEVVKLVSALSPNESPATALQSLAALTTPLEKHAETNASAPAVRAVFAGAATRIRELLDAEARARHDALKALGGTGTDDHEPA